MTEHAYTLYLNSKEREHLINLLQFQNSKLALICQNNKHCPSIYSEYKRQIDNNMDLITKIYKSEDGTEKGDQNDKH